MFKSIDLGMIAKKNVQHMVQYDFIENNCV